MATFTKIKKAQVEALTAEQMQGTFELNGLTIHNKLKEGFNFIIYLDNDKSKVIATFNTLFSTSNKSLKNAKNGLFKVLNVLNVLLNTVEPLQCDESSGFVWLTYVNGNTLSLEDYNHYEMKDNNNNKGKIYHEAIMGHWYGKTVYLIDWSK